ncbi:unnamed protein product [Adineta ricciae]|nr:unnamed protein product [Adineta ricciae]
MTLSFLNECIALSNSMVEIVLHGKVIANSTSDLHFGNACRDVTLSCIDLYNTYQTPSAGNEIEKQSKELIERLNSLIEKRKKGAST